MHVNAVRNGKSPFTILKHKVSHSEEETFELGKVLARSLKIGDVVALYGDLGSGKTKFIQGICSELGVSQNVTSPSFTIINEYEGKLKIFHFDFYRFETLNDAVAIGVEELFYDDGVCLIEWAERVGDILPPRRFEVSLQQKFIAGWENKREIEIRMWKP